MCELCGHPEIGAPDSTINPWPDDDEPMSVNEILAALGSQFRVPEPMIIWLRERDHV